VNDAVLSYLRSQHWAILEENLHLMAAIADRAPQDVIQQHLEAIGKDAGDRLAGTQRVRVRDGVAIVPITGPMFRHANLFTAFSGATSAEMAALDFSQALEDDSVTAIILEVNSPGGEVDGISELASLIFNARGQKPIKSFVSGLGASGAFWVATAADEVIAGDTATLGSVGVVLRVLDFRERDEKRGVKELEIVSSNAPNKRLDPFSADEVEAEQARAKILERINAIEDVFTSTLADHLDMTQEQVIEDFDRGGVLVGKHAVEAGMAHRLGTLDELVSELSTSRRARRQSISTGVRDMEIETAAALEQEYPQLVAQIREEARSAGKEEATSSATEEAIEEAVQGENDRVVAILELPTTGFEELRMECIRDPAVTAGDAALRILNAKGEQEQQRKTAVKDALQKDEKSLKDEKVAPGSTTDEGLDDPVKSQANRLKGAQERARRRSGSSRIASA